MYPSHFYFPIVALRGIYKTDLVEVESGMMVARGWGAEGEGRRERVVTPCKRTVRRKGFWGSVARRVTILSKNVLCSFVTHSPPQSKCPFGMTLSPVPQSPSSLLCCAIVMCTSVPLRWTVAQQPCVCPVKQSLFLACPHDFAPGCSHSKRS